jgi:hypothetical protein
MLHLHLYKRPVVYILCNTDSEGKLKFVNRYLQGCMLNRLSQHSFCSGSEGLHHLSEYMKSQNNRYWSAGSPMLNHEVPLHDEKVHVWCAMSASRIIGSISCSETINLHLYVTHCDTIL